MSLTPEAFVNKYQGSKLKESAVVRSHFDDLCLLLGQPRPLDVDPAGELYGFEKDLKKITGGKGYADVWLAGHFGWEYKGPGGDLKKAYQQLLTYREDLGNPPLLIVSDVRTIEVHTNFTGTQKAVETFTLHDLLDPKKRLRLKEAWVNPAAFNPTQTRADATAAAVRDLVTVGDTLKERGHPPEEVAHFLVKVVFTLFAQDVGLLPQRPFSLLLTASLEHGAPFAEVCSSLFRLMGEGGVSIVGRIPHINGGVFSDADSSAADTFRFSRAG